MNMTKLTLGRVLLATSALGASVRYDKHPGGHDWDYWDTHIKDVLAWLRGER